MKSFFRFFNLAILFFAVIALVSCSNLFNSNKTSVNLSFSSAALFRNASNTTYNIECILTDAKNNTEIDKKSKDIPDEPANHTFTFDKVEIGKSIIVTVNVYSESGKKLYTGYSDSTTIKAGLNPVKVQLAKYERQFSEITWIEYIYSESGPTSGNIVNTENAFKVLELYPDQEDNLKKVVDAWEVFDGEQYHYLFEDQTIEPRHGNNGKVILTRKQLTLGDVVLSNHQIIPSTEEIGDRTPIGVLASLQAVKDHEDQPTKGKVPLRVLSYKYKTGLAWCNDTSVPGYEASVYQPEAFNDKPCPYTGEDALNNYLDNIKNDYNISSIDFTKYPALTAASNMHDGDLKWFIPHGWEILGCTSDEIIYDNEPNNNNNNNPEYLINQGLEKIKEVLPNKDVLLLDLNTNYWTFGDNNSIHIGDAHWDSAEKTDTTLTTIFMAVLD